MYSRYSHISTNMPSSLGCTLLGSHSAVSEDSGLMVHGAYLFTSRKKMCFQ